MKTKLILLAACAAITSANAISTSVQWDEGLDFVNVRVFGTGMNEPENLTSPTGLWNLHFYNEGERLPSRDFGDGITSPGGILMSVNAYLSFGDAGDAYLFTIGYHQGIGPGEFPVTFNSFEEAIFNNTSKLNTWHGINTLAITSTPVLDDPSTWTWFANYQAFGPALNVPEGGSAWLMMAFASGILLCFRPKSA